jgi:hypothetical protein
MLSRTSYTREYVDACRARIASEVAAYRHLVATARAEAHDAARLDAAISAFEPKFFNTLVIALDGSFTHRARGLEGKDGNPLNEVRVVCESLMANAGALAADKQIKLAPETSILGYRVGDEVALGDAQFERLSQGYFAEIERRYPDGA